MLHPEPHERPQLRLEQLRMTEAEPESPASQEGVRLAGGTQVRNGLVAADVERADGEPAAFERVGDRGVDVELLVFVGWLGAVEEEELGAEEADAVGAVSHRLYGVVERGDVGDDVDARTVGGDGGPGAPGEQVVSSHPLVRGPLASSGADVRRRIDDDDTV